jgi:Periplasmic binding protein-like domain
LESTVRRTNFFNLRVRDDIPSRRIFGAPIRIEGFRRKDLATDLHALAHGLEIAELTTPELTTLEVPARDMGRLAADYVLASPLQRNHLKERELPIRLVVRESTGPAPATQTKRTSAIRRPDSI